MITIDSILNIDREIIDARRSLGILTFDSSRLTVPYCSDHVRYTLCPPAYYRVHGMEYIEVDFIFITTLHQKIKAAMKYGQELWSGQGLLF